MAAVIELMLADRVHLGADLVRLGMLLVGFTLAMSCVKFGYLAVRQGEPFRAWGLTSYGLLISTPAINGLYHFDEPLIIPSTVTYVAAMVFGIVALRAAYTVDTRWTHRRKRAPRV